MSDDKHDYPQAIDSLQTCIALLEHYKKAHYLSLALSLCASVVLLVAGLSQILSLYWFLTLSSVIVLGVLEIFFAIRVGFDINLLRYLLKNLQKDNRELDASLLALDNSLIRLNLLPSIKAGRSLDERLLGCLKLFKWQTLVSISQLAWVMIATCLYVLIWGFA